MTTRNKWILRETFLIAVFLAGFVPPYLEAKKTKHELQEAEQEIAADQTKIGLAQLRDLIAFVYVDTNQKNYGAAGQYSTQLCNQLRQLANETSVTSFKKNLRASGASPIRLPLGRQKETLLC